MASKRSSASPSTSGYLSRVHRIVRPQLADGWYPNGVSHVPRAPRSRSRGRVVPAPAPGAAPPPRCRPSPFLGTEPRGQPGHASACRGRQLVPDGPQAARRMLRPPTKPREVVGAHSMYARARGRHPQPFPARPGSGPVTGLASCRG